MTGMWRETRPTRDLPTNYVAKGAVNLERNTGAQALLTLGGAAPFFLVGVVFIAPPRCDQMCATPHFGLVLPNCSSAWWGLSWSSMA